MNKYGIAVSIVVFGAIAASSLTFSLAQDKNRSEADPRQELLGRLHPKPTERKGPGGIKLLPGYKHKGATDFEGNNTGEIWKKGGLKITYAMGFSWGQEADPKEKDKYLEYSERVVSRHVVRFAFTKEKVFIVSVPLADTPDAAYAANFSAKVQKPEDAADMVTMALSLIQRK